MPRLAYLKLPRCNKYGFYSTHAKFHVNKFANKIKLLINKTGTDHFRATEIRISRQYKQKIFGAELGRSWVKLQPKQAKPLNHSQLEQQDETIPIYTHVRTKLSEFTDPKVMRILLFFSICH